ncbi:glycine/betaine ABC transporter substrate-binding protein [Actinomadura sp. NBRC 104412]|uniref:glycine betaine ABC transporter substrate-binding protein n=1 Tax=Actinomadura sp. NBRC 104412 TaxID=3032203 RepID=UPI00249FF0C2|nr:glycine betaine ABC transporter substrate-binding protein [Actinomadura sp. NBRC 104412]GLZ04760.1 glycine/betaine ABC transporter substrate-binding protein [Actinomadura sp. NBRC 104412]
MRTPLRAIALAALAALPLGGCALGQSPGGDVAKGSLASKGSLDGVTLTVGSKEFTEQLVLCEITAVALESVGAQVKRSCGMSGSNTVRNALTGGSIDMYWEYTGTGWITHLKQTKPINDSRQQYEAVAKADLAQSGIRWLAPAPANNTYAIATTNEKAAQLGVKTISDYAALAKKDAKQATFCGAAEFLGRNDGWPGVEKTYGFDLPRSAVAELALGAVYSSIDKSSPCTFGEVFATDGRIKALGLTVLQDDKRFFAVYNPSLTVRKQVTDRSPQLADIIAPITAALDDEALRGLNAKVDVDGKTPEQAARDWLRSKGFIG